MAILGVWHIGILLQLTLPDDILSTRNFHSVTTISLAPGFIEVTMFGGIPHYIPNQHDNEVQSIAATTIITFSELNQCAHHVYREGVIVIA